MDVKYSNKFSSRSIPIYPTTAYTFNNAEHGADLFNLDFKEGVSPYIYTRLNNPTNAVLEQRMAALEGGVAAVAVASGQSAQMITIMNIMKCGDNFVTSPYLYGGTYNQFFVSFKDLGIEARKAASDSAEDMEKLIDENTKALYTENIGNPFFNVPDFEKLAALAQKYEIPLIVDNTFGCGGYLCQPIKFGANIVVEVVTRPGAQVKFSAVDNLGVNTTAFISRRGHLERDSVIEWAIGIMNDGNIIADFDSDLIGDGSNSVIKAVAISTERQIQGINTRVTNYGNHSVGHILQHGVILDRATLTFNGIGHIIKGAKGADAQQESRVLMLSESARGDANPILLIDENEVTAGHAASVGRVDPEQMFYLLSRGIEKEEAERLVIRGFLGAVITAIPLKEIRDELVEMIDKKLTRAEN